MRTTKRPDLKASRFRPSVLNLANRKFCEKARETQKDLKNLSDAEIKEIVRLFGEIVQEQVIMHADGVELPEQLGFLFIGSVPATRKGNIDYKSSNEQGQEVRYSNEKTEELTAKIFYTNCAIKYPFNNHDAWKFVPVRQFKRKVAAHYPTLFRQYAKVGSKDRVSDLFLKRGA